MGVLHLYGCAHVPDSLVVYWRVTERIGPLDGNGQFSLQWNRQTGTRHIPCTMKIFHDLPPFANWDGGWWGLLSHCILDIAGKIQCSCSARIFSSTPYSPKGALRISTGFQARSHDSIMSGQKQKHNKIRKHIKTSFDSIQNPPELLGIPIDYNIS